MISSFIGWIKCNLPDQTGAREGNIFELFTTTKEWRKETAYRAPGWFRSSACVSVEDIKRREREEKKSIKQSYDITQF